jgi:hypothetical protein
VKAFTLGATVILANSLLPTADPTLALRQSELAERAAAIKPVPQELRWQRIPWITDLAEAQRVAQAERRPIFLWVTGDDPLERC